MITAGSTPGGDLRTAGPGRPYDTADMAQTVLVTGATGYIGGRLVPRLLAEGHAVRAMTRDAGRLRDVPWASQVEVVEADALDPGSLPAALAGVDVAYYLIHSIDVAGGAFEDTDRRAAEAFGYAAKEAGVGRIVYLGGLVPHDEELSPHLASRYEVGQVLLDSGVPTAVLQAAVIIGSGSASFEMLRYLTERLPAMITPKWVGTRIQPIAVRDVLRYLVGAASLPPEVSRRFDLGGPEVLTYAQMMQRYAKVAGLRRRLIVPVPLLTPRLSGHWINLVTPVPAALARPLVRSMVNEVVCSEHDIAEHVPDPPEGLLGVDDAILLALTRIRELAVRDALVVGELARRAVGLAADRPLLGRRLALRRRAPPHGRGPPGGPLDGARGHRRRATAGTPSRSPGPCAACWTGSSAGSACAADGATRSTCTSASRSTGGASRSSSRAGCCGCGRR